MSIAPLPAPPAYQPYPPPVTTGRRWPRLVTAGLVAATVSGAIATVVTMTATTPDPAPTGEAPSTVTVTAAPATPAEPTPLPPAQADAATCAAWTKTRAIIGTAETALAGIPVDISVNDPEVAANPTWSSAVERAAVLLNSAGDLLDTQIAAGTTEVLRWTAETTAGALRSVAIAYTTHDPQTRILNRAMLAGKNAMGELCVP